MARVSIVVPIYQVEAYLARCVDSLLAQTVADLEIVLVDDGSTDASGEIAEAYAARDRRVTVIHQANGGLSAARNTGLRAATGDYVFFIDSDDYVEPTLVETAGARARAQHLDVVQFDYEICDSAGARVRMGQPGLQPGRVLEPPCLAETVYPILVGTHDLNSACFRAYRRAFLEEHRLTFREGVRYAEDYVFALELFPRVRRFGYLDVVLYHYQQNAGTIMSSYHPDKLEKIVYLYRAREQFMREQGIASPENARRSALLFLDLVIRNLPPIMAARGSLARRTRELRRVCRHADVAEALARVRPRDYARGRLGKLLFWALQRRALPLLLAGAWLAAKGQRYALRRARA